MPIKPNQLAAEPKVLDTQASKPTTGVGKGVFYPKTVSGVVEGHYEDDQGREIQITNNGNLNAAGSGEVNTASNLGAGSGVFASKVGVDLQFKSLVAGTNVTLTPASNTITIAATGTGEANTISSVGTGTSVVKGKSGVDLQIKSLIAGSGITLTPGTNDVTIASTGGAGTPTVLRRVTTTNTNDVQIVAYGSTVDVNSITVTKTANNVTLSTVPAGVIVQSIQVYFSGTDIGANTSCSITYPEPNGATALEQCLLPQVTRYQTSWNPFGTQAGAFSIAGSNVTFSHSGGVVANNAASLKLVF